MTEGAGPRPAPLACSGAGQTPALCRSGAFLGRTWVARKSLLTHPVIVPIQGGVRRAVLILGVLGGLLLGATSASAAPPSSAAPSNVTRFPVEIVQSIVHFNSPTARPPGFTTDANQAIAAAKTSPVMQALHRREHPLGILADVWLGGKTHFWYIVFSYHGNVAGQVNVSRTGRILGAWTGPEAIAPYSHGNYAQQFDVWWVVVPFSVLFMVPFFDPRRLRRLTHLDALVVLSFLVSYALFDHVHLVASVWLAYPPMLYLVVRMLWLGMRGSRGAGRVAPLLPTPVLWVGLLVLMGARIALSFADPHVIDVGYASVLGAFRIAHGMPIYYPNPAHGDTYGPVTYLLYVPFEALFPWHGRWDYVMSAHVASVVFDVLTVVGLVVLGRRLRQGSDGRRLGLALAWGWAACPFTLLALMLHSNDGMIAMLSVFSLLVFASPAARGAMLGLAAAAKFSPAALLPLYAGRDRRGLKGTIICGTTFLAVVAVAIVGFVPPQGFSYLYHETIGFQLTRQDVFSPWALHPGLAPVKDLVEVAVLLLAGFVAFVPRNRSLVQVCALAASVTVAVQLTAIHWFYFYIVWFVPFVLVAVLAAPPAAPDVDQLPRVEDEVPLAIEEPAPVPALLEA